jgi:Photosynthetic reaction centre cytochrome C subunit
MRRNFILRPFFKRALGTAFPCVLTVAPALAQPAPQQKPVMVEDVFKNLQVLKGIPVNQFMDTMGFFAAALGLNCTGCHVAESLQNWDKFAEDVPRKRIARVMIQMVNNINKANFGGARSPATPAIAAAKFPTSFPVSPNSTLSLRKMPIKSRSSRMAQPTLPRIRFSTSIFRRSAGRRSWRASPVLPRRGRWKGTTPIT